MTKKLKMKLTGELYRIGKSEFVITVNEENFWVWRKVRGHWQLLAETETESGAMYHILHAVAKVSDFKERIG